MKTKVIVLLALLVLFVNSSCPFSKDIKNLVNRVTTPKGCLCSKPCGGNILDDAAKCDRCYTYSECGRWSVNGHFDYCIYPINRNYENQTAQQKQEMIWNKIKQNPTPGSHHNLLNLLQMSVATTFDSQWDEMPAQRPKIIHSVGAVCKFSFQTSANSPYTGLWAPNARSIGLIRLGSASKVTTSSGVVPGIGIKFLRSKVLSANFVALFSLEPLPNKSYNFFERELTNKIPPAIGFIEIAIAKFKQASQCPFHVGLSDVCSYTFEGERVARPVFPYQVKLKSQLQIPNKPMTEEGLLSEFRKIPVGSKLYDIYAFANPRDVKENRSILLGSVVTTSECTSSKYGDEKLFFRHQRIEDDWKLRPEWLSEIEPKACAQSELELNPPRYCPSKV